MSHDHRQRRRASTTVKPVYADGRRLPHQAAAIKHTASNDWLTALLATLLESYDGELRYTLHVVEVECIDKRLDRSDTIAFLVQLGRRCQLHWGEVHAISRSGERIHPHIHAVVSVPKQQSVVETERRLWGRLYRKYGDGIHERIALRVSECRNPAGALVYSSQTWLDGDSESRLIVGGWLSRRLNRIGPLRGCGPVVEPNTGATTPTTRKQRQRERNRTARTNAARTRKNSRTVIQQAAGRPTKRVHRQVHSVQSTRPTVGHYPTVVSKRVSAAGGQRIARAVVASYQRPSSSAIRASGLQL